MTDVPVKKVEPNPGNPRKIFPEDEIQELRESIDARGVLVPVNVYRHPDKKGHYVLIDGECRFQCAQELGLSKIPAVVRDEVPTRQTTLLEMFHIHRMRHEWQDLPTAQAIQELQQIAEESGEEPPTVDELVEMTGIAPKQVERLLFLLRLPKEYQDLVKSGTVGTNYFWEIKTNGIDPLQKKRPLLFKEFSEEEIIESLIEKRMTNTIKSAPELRRLRQVIDAALLDAGSQSDQPSDLDDEIRKFLRTPEMSLDDVTSGTVEMLIALDKFRNRSVQVVNHFRRILKKGTAEQQKEAVEIAEGMIAEIQSEIG